MCWEPSIKEDCPNCGEIAEADGIHNGVGYIYPPLHCSGCGWSEQCYLWGTDRCTKKCTEYEKCTQLNKSKEE